MTQYSGKIIRKNAVVPTQQSASGVWTVTDAAAATRNNAWPVAGVPDPISRSVRIRSSASAYFSRTPAVAGSRTTWTMSFWMKLGNSSGSIFGGASASNNPRMQFYYTASTGYMEWYQSDSGGGTVFYLIPNQLFRDPSAWYHIVVVADTTQATSSNRLKWYVNGVQVTSFNTATYPSQNTNTEWNTNTIHNIGRQPNASAYWDGYLTEMNFIDGQALTPSSFGTTDAFTGAWVPMAYTGTYGTNGFYLNFKDNTSTTTLGYDYSGNSNNWTANNISLTAGTTYDSMLDVPTPWIGYNTDGGVSVTRGNYCTINPNDTNGSAVSITNGNLTFNNSSSVGVRRGTLGSNSGYIYFEITQDSTVSSGAPINYGMASLNGSSVHNNLVQAALAYTDNSGNKAFWRTTTAGIVQTVTPSAYSMAIGDVFQVAYDANTGKLWFGKNNTWYDGSGGTTGNPSTGVNPVFTLPDTTQPMAPIFEHAGGVYTASLNCGQRPFSYTPPTGFKALCTTNLPEPTIKLGASYMAASTWTGTGATLSIVNSGNNTTATTFQPDFVWAKDRTTTNFHALYDSVRGATKVLQSNTTTAEQTFATGLTSFNSNGFTTGSNSDTNTNGNSYVGWQWKANGAAVSNTAGSITSQVSAGTTQGFSVVTYTGNNSTATIGHGLGAAPSMIIIKDRLQGAGYNWNVYHVSLGNTKRIFLDTTTDGNTAGVWNNTSPTSTVFTVTNNAAVNGTDTYVAYCFAAVDGYSAISSFTGNASADGPFVYCGFRPRFLLMKNADSGTQGWTLENSAAQTYNEINNYVFAQSSAAEGSTYAKVDFLSNGFKIRTSDALVNGSGNKIIYMAFAENPFKYSNAR